MKLTNLSAIKLIFGLSLISSSNAFAWTYLECCEFIEDNKIKAYVGADAHMRNMNYVKGYGENMFSKSHPKGNVFLGLRFMDNWGIEGGIESTPMLHSEVNIADNETYLGIKATDPVTHQPVRTTHYTKSAIKGWHIGLMGYVPTFELACAPVELVGYAGMTRLNIFHKHTPVLVGNVPAHVHHSTSTFDSTKSILKLAAGLQYMFDTSGVRFMLAYENTDRFNNILSHEGRVRDGVPILKLKDSFSASMGVFVTTP